MKKNKKGFMLAEAVVSSTVIITSMILLYSTFNRLYFLYSEKNSYYNIDAVYATKTMINSLMDNNFEKTINDIFVDSTYKVIMEDYIQDEKILEEKCLENETSPNDSLCTKLKDIYKVNRMIISEYDKSTLEEDIKNLTINQSFKDYIDYIVGYYGVSNHDTKYSYIVLTEIKDGADYYYANLGIG